MRVRGGRYRGLTILDPLDETLFPPEIAPPTFRWSDRRKNSDTWLVSVEFSGGQDRAECLVFDERVDALPGSMGDHSASVG